MSGLQNQKLVEIQLQSNSFQRRTTLVQLTLKLKSQIVFTTKQSVQQITQESNTFLNYLTWSMKSKTIGLFTNWEEATWRRICLMSKVSFIKVNEFTTFIIIPFTLHLKKTNEFCKISYWNYCKFLSFCLISTSFMQTSSLITF